jgi:glycosyltransferase involved in cell wall biosynthesis
MIKNKLSVVIPSRNEIFLNKTVDDLFEKASGDVEVIVTLDGYWHWPQLLPKENKNLIYVHFGQARGMRAAINAAATIAKGQYLMKCDAHCMFAEGYDEALKANCDENWMAIPSRYSLDGENWEIKHTGKSRVDYHYLSYPKYKGHGIHGTVWNQRARERKDSRYDIDDEMSFQGSCWFMHRKHYWDFLGGMDEDAYGEFIQEPQEIGMKTWLGGGRIVTNKKTWYAHLHKGKAERKNEDVAQQGRGYFLSKNRAKKGNDYSAWFWLTDQWEDRVHDIDWFVDKFDPPQWPDNWKEILPERI